VRQQYIKYQLVSKLPGTHFFSFPFKYKDSLFKEKKRKKNVSKQKETGRGQAETRERDVSP
jgi:hypothetical protein